MSWLSAGQVPIPSQSTWAGFGMPYQLCMRSGPTASTARGVIRVGSGLLGLHCRHPGRRTRVLCLTRSVALLTRRISLLVRAGWLLVIRRDSGESPTLLSSPGESVRARVLARPSTQDILHPACAKQEEKKISESGTHYRPGESYWYSPWSQARGMNRAC